MDSKSMHAIFNSGKQVTFINLRVVIMYLRARTPVVFHSTNNEKAEWN